MSNKIDKWLLGAVIGLAGMIACVLIRIALYCFGITP